MGVLREKFPTTRKRIWIETLGDGGKWFEMWDCIFINAIRSIRDDNQHHMLTVLVKPSDSFCADCPDMWLVCCLLRAKKFQSSPTAYIHLHSTP
jgi:hypothetical protein